MARLDSLVIDGPGDAQTPPDPANTSGGVDVAERTCSIAECENPSYVRGWCTKHYERWRIRGDVMWEPPPLRPVRNGRSRDAERSAVYREQNPGAGRRNSTHWRVR